MFSLNVTKKEQINIEAKAEHAKKWEEDKILYLMITSKNI
jgi:hypothetical protein